jgi:hypothetical protein
MQIAKEYVARAWILEDLRQHVTTDELDEVILFAREAGYLDADAQLTDAGERYFRLMTEGKKHLVPTRLFAEFQKINELLTGTWYQVFPNQNEVFVLNIIA